MRLATFLLLVVFSHACAAPEVWRDTGILLDAPDTAPRHVLLTYREALHFGMRFLHGIDVWPLDPDDRRIGSRFAIGADEFDLVVSSFSADGKRTVTVTRAGRKEVMAFKPVDGLPPLEKAAELALTDLPAILNVLERKEPALPGLGSQDVPSPEPAAPLDVWRAVRPLEKKPAEVTGPELGRAALALAWSALLDVRIGPAGAPILAAQAAALAAVAVKRLGTSLQDAAAAAWLAPAAASGDFWLLARTPPPNGYPELYLLHQAYQGTTLDSERMSIGQAVADTERALAVDASSECWSIAKEAAGIRLAEYYTSQMDEFSALVKSAGRPFAFVLQDLQAIADDGLALPPELKAKMPPPPKNESVGADAIFARAALTFQLGRECATQGAKARSWPARWILQETGDRALHAMCPFAAQFANYGWDDKLTTMFAPVKAMADWFHPEVQWLLTDNQAFKGKPEPQPIGNSAVALVSIPRLAHRTAIAEPAQRISGRLAWFVRLSQLTTWSNSPGVIAEVLIDAARGGHPAVALVLLRKLLRDHPNCKAPFYGRILASLPAAMKREIFALAKDEPSASATLAHERATLLLAAGDAKGAEAVATPALMRTQTPELAVDLIYALCRQQKYDEADKNMEYVRAKLPGITRSSVMLAFANELLDAGQDARAASWGERGAETRAAWAYTGHAMIALALGDAATAKAQSAAGSAHYGPSESFSLVNDLAAVVESKGQIGWVGIETQLKNQLPNEWDAVAKTLARARVPFPATPFGKKLAFALDVSRLGGDGAPDPKKVAQLLPRTYGKDEVSAWCKTRLALEALPLISRSLMRGGAGMVLDSKLIWPLFWLVSQDTFTCVHAVLHVMAARGASDARLDYALKICTPLLQPADRALAKELAQPGRLARWLMVTNVAAPLDANLGEFLMSAWLTDDRAGALALLDALVPKGAAAKPRPLLPFLTLLAGSDTLAVAFLSDRGVKEADLKAWGWADELRALPKMMAPIARLRPPGASENLLK